MRISERFMPIYHYYALYHKLEKSVLNSLLKLHILTGCNVISKVGTKLAAIKAFQEVNLWKFCNVESEKYSFKDAKLYLVKVLHGKSTYSIFSEIRYVTFLLLFFQSIIFLPYSKQQKSDNSKIILVLTIKEQSFNYLNSLIT